jgi:hypothetical protein
VPCPHCRKPTILEGYHHHLRQCKRLLDQQQVALREPLERERERAAREQLESR